MTPQQQATAARLADDPRRYPAYLDWVRHSDADHDAWRDEVLTFLRTLATQPTTPQVSAQQRAVMDTAIALRRTWGAGDWCDRGQVHMLMDVLASAVDGLPNGGKT